MIFERTRSNFTNPFIFVYVLEVMISLKAVTTYSFQLVSHRTGNTFLHHHTHSFQTRVMGLFLWKTEFPKQEIFSCKQICLLVTLVGYKRHLMIFDILFPCHSYSYD